MLIPFLDDNQFYDQLGEYESNKGKLSSVACAVLVKVPYATRAARWDLLKAVGLFATGVSKWTYACEKVLHRLMCYISSSLDLVRIGVAEEYTPTMAKVIHEARATGVRNIARIKVEFGKFRTRFFSVL